jgi:hypothetical protein
MAFSAKVYHWNIAQFKEWVEQDDLLPEVQIVYETTLKEIEAANYPKPDDCFEEMCLKFRPTCQLGICRIAIILCDPYGEGDVESREEEQSNIVDGTDS